MVKYVLHRNRQHYQNASFQNEVEEQEEITEVENSVSHSPFSRYREGVDRLKKHYNDSINNQKDYYASDDDWRIQEQFARDRDFMKKLLIVAGVIAVLALVYFLLKIVF
ncbi:hypothetical protein [Streptococcus ferus]|uniref:hypothetical protein n=1 Tax=Streptococcus ferus TaxID=1345 RepID=UPI0035A17713